MNKRTHTGGPGRAAPHARRKHDRDLFLGVPWLFAAAACLLALWAIATYAWVVAGRLRYPYDLGGWSRACCAMPCACLTASRSTPRRRSISSPPVHPALSPDRRCAVEDRRQCQLSAGPHGVAFVVRRRAGHRLYVGPARRRIVAGGLVALSLPLATFADAEAFTTSPAATRLQLFLTVKPAPEAGLR